MVIAFITTGMAFGAIMAVYSSWDDLIDQAPDVVIAKCTLVMDAAYFGKPVISDGSTMSQIEILQVLKGQTNPGPSRLLSTYRPKPGEQFLLFARYRSDHYFTGYNSIEATPVYPVVLVNSSFNTNELAGKSLKEQIQLILKRRLADLNAELLRDNDEKKRLEQGLNGNTNGI